MSAPRLGILGGGQLGRMLALAAARLGIRCRCWDPSPEAVAGDVAELICAPFDDARAMETFLAGLEAVTLEFENVPVALVEKLAAKTAMYPGPRALSTGQDRVAEKTLFNSMGLETPEWRAADTRESFERACTELGLPIVAKTRRMGYDGKGQAVVRRAEDVGPAYARLTGEGVEGDETSRRAGLIVEKLVPFTRELSILGVRGRDGTTAFYPLVENVHRAGMLRRSIAPAPGVDETTEFHARASIARVMDALGYVGVMAVELFEVGGRLLGNELAPRVHNSGHWTIEGSASSQFENHVRAVMGLALGSTAMVAPRATMVNFIGRMPTRELLALPGVAAHDYAKLPRAGRKVGHATVLSCDPQTPDPRLAEVERLAEAADKG
ncbi:MAG: 5-(carboxyamino)imidazole ribonucleotide synthase [Planctomycetota bacterium]|nr:5-(carboxyamino)imidazole ribonucleotide synthase [Planctomycetota bacterium]